MTRKMKLSTAPYAVCACTVCTICEKIRYPSPYVYTYINIEVLCHVVVVPYRTVPHRLLWPRIWGGAATGLSFCVCGNVTLSPTNTCDAIFGGQLAPRLCSYTAETKLELISPSRLLITNPFPLPNSPLKISLPESRDFSKRYVRMYVTYACT